MTYCKACSRPAGTDFIVAMGAVWHREHFRCFGCGKPILESSFSIREEQPYHEACSLALCPRCRLCGSLCTGAHFIDQDKQTFCEHCHRGAHPCFYCSRTVGAGRVCEVCGDPVRAGAEARIHLVRMVEWVRRHGVPLRWAAEDIDLRSVATVPGSGSTLPGAQHRLGLTTVQCREFRSGAQSRREYQVSILMKDDMPETSFRGVAAHELGHVWLLTEDLGRLPQDETEGLCELFAFLYYKSLGSPEGDRHARRIRENPDPVYGGGFRKVFGVFERIGMTALCTGLVRERRLPTVPSYSRSTSRLSHGNAK